jgi:uroporphyrinogen decarboxylase
MQTPGIFECLNDPFGIENHLCWLALYPDELKEVYARQAAWNSRFASNIIDLGIDCIHVSDDWGAQRSLLFSYDMFKELIFPFHKITADFVKSRDVFLSLHSDGYVAQVIDDVIELGYDMVHPWQESAGMTYDNYIANYQDRLAILGGVCIQTTLGFGDLKRLESEIRRVFNLLKGQALVLLYNTLCTGPLFY